MSKPDPDKVLVGYKLLGQQRALQRTGVQKCPLRHCSNVSTCSTFTSVMRSETGRGRLSAADLRRGPAAGRHKDAKWDVIVLIGVTGLALRGPVICPCAPPEAMRNAEQPETSTLEQTCPVVHVVCNSTSRINGLFQTPARCCSVNM